MNFIFGAGGFAKEAAWLLSEPGSYFPVDFFVDIERSASIHGIDVISENDFYKKVLLEQQCNAFICTGDPVLKSKIYEKIKTVPGMAFPAIKHASLIFDSRKDFVKIGAGTIICGANSCTTDIVIGNFVHVNPGCTIGHDSMIGDFTTLTPGVHISGNVTVGKRVFIGAGAVVLQELTICDDAIIGAGAVVTKSITEPGTYAGVPAKKIK